MWGWSVIYIVCLNFTQTDELKIFTLMLHDILLVTIRFEGLIEFISFYWALQVLNSFLSTFIYSKS